MNALKLFIAVLIVELMFIMATTSLFIFGLINLPIFAIFSVLALIMLILTFTLFKLIKMIIITNRTILKVKSEKLRLKEVLRKPRKRYIVFQIVSEKPLRLEEVKSLIDGLIKETFGLIGSGNINAKLISYDEQSMKGIIRCVHTYKDAVLFALALASIKTGDKINIIPLKTTGTLRKAREIVKTLSID